LDAVDPTFGGRALHHVCIADHCQRHGPSVTYGSVVLTLCARHKADFDRRWQNAFDKVEIAS
jgi:hypothetical protein